MTETYRTYSSTFLSEKVSEDECHPLPLWEVPWNPPGLLFLVGKKIQAFLFFFFSEKSSAGQLGSLQFLKEHSLEIEYYQKSVNVRENIASQYSNGIHTSKTAATLIAM